MFRSAAYRLSHSAAACKGEYVRVSFETMSAPDWYHRAGRGSGQEADCEEQAEALTISVVLESEGKRYMYWSGKSTEVGMYHQGPSGPMEELLAKAMGRAAALLLICP